MHFSHLSWNTLFLKDNQTVRTESFGIPAKVKTVKYPLRLMRYWFMYHFLRKESQRGRKTLSVCELGVDVGQMKLFMDSAAEKIPLSRWLAVDCLIRKDTLESAGYGEFVEADLESPDFSLNGRFDAMILLHILEHLDDPEAAVRKLVPHLKEGGIMAGGFPVTPNRFMKAREDKIRKTAGKFGHVSVFSPKRVREMAEKSGMTVEYLTGAFFMRKQGFFLENYDWWLRFNLFWAALFPSWPGEIYWILRKNDRPA